MNSLPRAKQHGFTIVELLIVIVVIAILAAITIVAYNGIQSRAELSVASANASMVAKKMKLFKIINGVYPTSIDDCPNPTSANICLSSLKSDTYSFASVNNYSSPFYEFTSFGNSQFLYTSGGERSDSSENEFIRCTDLVPIINKYGLKEYEISFDIRSLNTSSRDIVKIYNQDSGGSKYIGLSENIPVTTAFARHVVSFTPIVNPNGSSAKASVAFYGTYGTDNVPIVKNIQIKLK